MRHSTDERDGIVIAIRKRERNEGGRGMERDEGGMNGSRAALKRSAVAS